MEKKLEKIRIGDDEIYMKKSFDGWRVTYPPKNDDGTWNWKNLILGGSIWNFVKVLIVVLLLITVIVIYHYDTKTCSDTLTHLDTICEAYRANPGSTYGNLNNLLPKVNNATG